VQKANTYSKHILLQIEYNGGHGDNEDKLKTSRKEAKNWLFLKHK
jgi:prolyl oligopeptidase PreP (S9A serine peptidase family)